MSELVQGFWRFRECDSVAEEQVAVSQKGRDIGQFRRANSTDSGVQCRGAGEDDGTGLPEPRHLQDFLQSHTGHGLLLPARSCPALNARAAEAYPGPSAQKSMLGGIVQRFGLDGHHCRIAHPATRAGARRQAEVVRPRLGAVCGQSRGTERTKYFMNGSSTRQMPAQPALMTKLSPSVNIWLEPSWSTTVTWPRITWQYSSTG